MRLVTGPEGMAQHIESAERESLKAFGSDEIFAERCITPARHIEVQVVADCHGGVVALGTRDCTLQRSNQKIIEEGPASGLAPGAELELCEAACRLAKAARYRSLGTVEFLYAPDGSFYFLEVNTRLQVEHPVTEMVTGLDLVEAQIRIAEGNRLAELGIQGTPQQQGHAIEARLCAEELRAGSFVLSSGIVQEFEVPTRNFSAAQVRVDSGVEPCSEVTHYYDSLIAKIIVHAPSRNEAIKALHECLSRARISGVQTNRGLLLHLLAHPVFAAQSHTIQGTAALLPSESDLLREAVIAHAVAAALRCSTGHSPWAARSPWLTGAPASAKLSFPWTTASSGQTISSTTSASDEGATVIISVSGGDSALTVSLDDIAPAQPSGTALRATVGPDARDVRATIVRDGAHTWVHLRSGSICLEERTAPRAARGSGSSHAAREVTAHIPGKVAAVSVAIGEQVSAGQILLVLDSMKMEHPIKAPVAGRVAALPHKAGTIVQTGATLVTLEDT
jgi:acetyl/propionyl-CoA carboxylase alpha subunit